MSLLQKISQKSSGSVGTKVPALPGTLPVRSHRGGSSGTAQVVAEPESSSGCSFYLLHQDPVARRTRSSGSLCAGTFAAACGPHASLRVIVVVEVPQPKPLHLQPCLQDPGRSGWNIRTRPQMLWLGAALAAAGAWGWEGFSSIG